MTKLSRVLAVFVVTAALAFMGFAAVNLAGGPNWSAEQQSIADRYVFDYTPGETPTWAVKTNLKSSETHEVETVVPAAKSLPEAVVAALKHRATAEKAKVDALAERIEPLEKRLAEARALIDVDMAAMKKRSDDLADAMKQLHQQIDQVSKEGLQLARQTLNVRNEGDLRAADVERLLSQLDEIRTDHFQILKQYRLLEDQLVRLDAVLQRLERRKKQLEASGAKTNRPNA